MRKAAWIGGGLIAILAVGALALPYLVNLEQMRGAIRGRLKDQLARDVEFAGMSLRLWPLSVALADLRIAEAPDFPTGKPFLTAKEIRVRVNLPALLRQNISVEDFEVVEPSLELVRDGERWNYLTLGRSSGSDQPSEVRLKRLDVVGGTLAVSELGKPATRTVYDGVDLSLSDVAPGRIFGLNASTALGVRFAGQGNPLKGKLTVANAPLGKLTRIDRLEGRVNGEADIDSQGTVISARGALDVADAGYRGTPVKAQPLHADFNVSVDDGKQHVEALKLRLGQGTITVAGDYPMLRVKSDQLPFGDLTRLATAFDVKIPAGVTAKGNVAVDLNVNAQNTSATGTVRATNLELSGASLRQPVRTRDVTLEITPAVVSSRDFVAETAGARLQTDFELRDYAGKAPTVDAVVRTEAAGVGDLVRLARAYGVDPPAALNDARGTASLDLRISGPVQQVSRLRFSGKGSLRDAVTGQTSVDQAAFDFAGDVIRLTAGQLHYQDLTLKDLRTTVKLLGDSQIRLDPLVAGVFGGQHTGAVTIDQREKFPKLRLQSKLERADANQILSRFASLKQVIYGTFSAESDLSLTLGDDVAKSLNGTLHLRLADGKLAGFNLLDEVAGLGKFLGWMKKKDDFTSFLEIAGALRLNQGTASTDALKLRLDQALVEASGAINLIDQTLKMKSVTTLGRELSDRVGGSKIGGFMNTAFSTKLGELVIPAIVTGSLTKPKFLPDAEAMARMRAQQFEPEKAKQQIEKIFDVFRKKKP